MNNLQHTANIPMKDYLEYKKMKEGKEQEMLDLDNALVELFDAFVKEQGNLSNAFVTTNFLFRKDNRTGRDRIQVMKRKSST